MAEKDRFLRTVERIHAAGLDGGQWGEALASIARLFGSLGATLEIFEKRPIRLIDLRIVGLPPRAETEYLSHYAVRNPRAEYAFRHLSEITLCDYQLIDEGAMDRSAYYAKYLRSLDLRYFLSGQIVNTPTIQGVVTIQRSRRQGHVQRCDIERMRQLLPHVSQAYEVATRLKSTRGIRQSLEEALNWLDDGVALLGDEGQVIHANDALLDIARRPGGEIRILSKRLEFAACEARAHFAKAFAVVAHRRNGIGETATDFPVAREAGTPAYRVSVRPMVAGMASGAGAACAAIVFVHDPGGRESFALPALKEVFSLTDAEALLARALVAGISPNEYARSRGLSANTVYTHLRRIKEKAHSAHLPELIRKLNNAMPAVRREGAQ